MSTAMPEPVVARVWQGRTPAAIADMYADHLYEHGIKKIRGTKGNLGVQVLRRIDGDVAWFTTISYWDRATRSGRMPARTSRSRTTFPLAPDFVRETFRPSAEHGERTSGERGLRYLEWIFDPDGSDTKVAAHFAFLLREGDRVWAEHDRHTFGLFARADWLHLLQHAGFEPGILHDEFGRDLFVAGKPGR